MYLQLFRDFLVLFDMQLQIMIYSNNFILKNWGSEFNFSWDEQQSPMSVLFKILMIMF